MKQDDVNAAAKLLQSQWVKNRQCVLCGKPARRLYCGNTCKQKAFRHAHGGAYAYRKEREKGQTMHLKLGLPYLGGKRAIAWKIVDKILADNPKCEYIWDLFGGGGAISFEAMQRQQIKQVYYNELNTGVVALLADIRDNGLTDKYAQWVSRETFTKHKNDDDWFGGLCKVIWSFGNNQRKYLFGKDVEPIKKEAHDYLLEHGYKLGEKDKRIALIEQFKKDKKINERFQLERLQQLEQLEQLERLERLGDLKILTISNKSYAEVEITTPINNTIIYLDPPYIGTEKYQKDICHKQLYEWIEKSPYKIYLSSYQSDLECVAEYEHRCTYAPKKNNKTLERLFTNNKPNLGMSK